MFRYIAKTIYIWKNQNCDATVYFLVQLYVSIIPLSEQNVPQYSNYSPIDLTVQFVSFRIAAMLKEFTALIHLDFNSDNSISSSLDHPPKQSKKKMQLMIVAKKLHRNMKAQEAFAFQLAGGIDGLLRMSDIVPRSFPSWLQNGARDYRLSRELRHSVEPPIEIRSSQRLQIKSYKKQRQRHSYGCPLMMTINLHILSEMAQKYFRTLFL